MRQELAGSETLFVSGLDYVELMGANTGYVFYLEETSGLTIVRKHPLRLIMPNANLPDAIAKAMKVPCNEAVQTVKRLLPMWMH